MPITCEINFENNPQKVIYSGQMMLRGSVQLNLSAEKNVRGVYIELFGGECASWTSGIGRYQKSYIAEELYLNKRIYFVSGGSGDARLAAGIHNYSFECDLPTSLPTTMESENGYIRYVARVVFDIPLWPSKIITQPFTVIKPVDLNTVPTLRYPITFEKTDTITGIDWLCWLYADPMKISVRIPLSGYVPGQTIKVQINVSNQTGQPISGIMVKLIRKVTLFASAHGNRKQQKTDISTMTKTKVDGCDKYQNKMIYANVPVSATPPTDLSSSKIIKICYVIRVITMTSSYWNGDAIVDVPITIGTHPIRDNVAENMTSIPNIPFVLSGNVVSLQPSELQSVEEDAPPYSSLLTSPPPFPNDELPTYAEALNPNDENILKPIHLMLKHSNEGQL